jgi:hypothetical protein
MNHNAKLVDTMKTLTFGVEIETVAVKRAVLANAVAACLRGFYPGDVRVVFEGTYYDKHAVVLPDGRKWIVMSDGSLSHASGNSAEVVTPICTWVDLEAIQAVARALRAAGAQVNSSCGVHVHVGTPATRFDTAALVRLAKLVYQQEPLIVKALNIAADRLGHYTKQVDETFIRRLSTTRPGSPAALATAWYGSESSYAAQRDHYHHSRYRGLNMHSVFFRGTVEFRYFEGTLHAGQIKSNVQLCLALATKALTSKGAMARKRTFNPATAKYDFRVFLLRLGLIGDEFKTARKLLMAHLEGSSSYKNGPPSDRPSAPAVEAPAPAAPPDASNTVSV